MGTASRISSAMDSDLLSTSSGRAGLRATLTLASEAVLRQICINRGLETYDKDRAQLEDAVTMLINALDRLAEIANEQDVRMAELGASRSSEQAVEPKYSPGFTAADDNLVYDRTADEGAQFQEQILRERADDKQ